MTSTSRSEAANTQTQTIRYSVVLNWDEQTSTWEVTVPALNGVVTCGDTVEEALEMARDLINITIEDMEAEGETVPRERVPVQLHDLEIPIG
jgi:predicted RNase H-like HicB family nuclease